MPKAPTTDTIAAELTVPERVLLFCLASDTNWVKSGVSHSTAQHLLVRNLVERDHATDFALTDQGRAVPDELLGRSGRYPIENCWRMSMRSLRRYTNLAATIHLLRTKRITLLDPATWDDKNDAYFMEEYKRYKKAGTLLALCFSETSETYHHWRVFSHGSDGVCIEFDKDNLLSAFENAPEIKTGYVDYKKINDLNGLRTMGLEQLPFLKRYPYKDEREFRVVYVDSKSAVELKNYKIEVGWIRRITLSPWMTKALASSVKETLKTIGGCSGIKISQSTLVDNEAWKKCTARVRI
jgi:hypothetical protein